MKKIFLVTTVMILILVGCSGEINDAEDKSNSSTIEESTSVEEPTSVEDESVIGVNDVLAAENFEFTILSVTSSSSFTNALNVEYTADDGYELVMIVFSAKNVADDTMNVMNTNFNSYVDGVKLTIEAAAGEIDGYMPLLGAVSSEKVFEGYAIWQLPEGWETFEFSYIDALSGQDSDAFTVLASDVQ